MMGDFYVLHGSALGIPALSVCVVYHFVAELVVAPKCFHFIIIALTVDEDRSSRAESS